MPPALRWVSTRGPKSTCMSSLQLLTYTVTSFSLLPEHMFSPSNLIFYLKTSEYSRPWQTFFFLNNGSSLFKKKKKKLLPPLGLLLCVSVYLLFSYFIFPVCAYVPFPQPQWEIPKGKDFPYVSADSPRPQQWLAMCHPHSMAFCVLILCGGSAKALVRAEGNVKLPPD